MTSPDGIRKGTAMPFTFRTSLPPALAVAFMLSACATPQERVASKEDHLIAAGFVARPADTPQRQALLARLPPHHFVMRNLNGQYVYMYADPLVCGCLYVGSDAAYTQYRKMLFQQNLANEQETAAQLNSDPGWSFGGWGGQWGPGFGTGFGPGFY